MHNWLCCKAPHIINNKRDFIKSIKSFIKPLLTFIKRYRRFIKTVEKVDFADKRLLLEERLRHRRWWGVATCGVCFSTSSELIRNPPSPQGEGFGKSTSKVSFISVGKIPKISEPNFLLISPSKKHNFLEKLIDKYIKVSVIYKT